MDIWMIWGRYPDDDILWLINAWDDDSVANNYDRWSEIVEKAKQDHGQDNIRIVRAPLEMDQVAAAFNPAVSIFGEPRSDDPDSPRAEN